MSYYASYVKEHRDQEEYERLKQQAERRKEMAKLHAAAETQYYRPNEPAIPRVAHREDSKNGQ
jgi:hypothetical protein